MVVVVVVHWCLWWYHNADGYPLMRPQCLRETKVCEVSTRRRTVVDIGVHAHTLTFHTHTYTHTHTRATYMVPIHINLLTYSVICKAANRLVGLSSSTSVLEGLQKSLLACDTKKKACACHGTFVFVNTEKIIKKFVVNGAKNIMRACSNGQHTQRDFTYLLRL